MASKLSLQDVLKALGEPGKKPAAHFVEHFSNLDPDGLEEVLKTWPQIPVKNQRALLMDFNARYDDDLLLSFDALAVALINDPDAEVRALALHLLKETDDDDLIPALIDRLSNDPEELVRYEAAGVLGQYVYYGEMEEIDPELLAKVEESLLAARNDSAPDVQRRAVESLGYSSRPEARTLIEEAFSHHDPKWIATALFAMGRSGQEHWQEQVLTMLNNEDALIRFNAVRAAGELSIAPARAILLELLEDEEDDDVTSAAIWSLSQIGGEDARTYLENLIAETDDEEQIDFLEEALENLNFTEDMEKFDLMGFDPDNYFDEDEDEE
jgi:HEAT repeat protein